MKTAIPYNPLNHIEIEQLWIKRANNIRRMELAASKLGNGQLKEHLGQIHFRIGRRLQDLNQMSIDYKLHFPYYTPNPIDWNRGQPTKVSTLKPVKL